MTQKKTPILTEAEFRIMNTLWTLGLGTVHDILDALPKGDKPEPHWFSWRLCSHAA